MKRFGTVAALVAAAALSGAAAAHAQLPGMPNQPVETGLGISLSADYAQPDNDLGGGSAYGVSGGIGFSRFGISASVGSWNPDAAAVGAEVTYAGRLGMKLIGGGLNPLTVGAQVGVSSVAFDFGAGSERATAINPGLWAKLNPPLFPLKPWAHVYYQTGNSNVDDEVRIAAGANFNLLLGFGVHAGYDWGDSGATWGVGAHFNFRVPGLGVPGM